MSDSVSNNTPLLLFPCDYSLKIIGLAGIEFETVVLPILNKHIPNLLENAIAYNKSRGEKYLALTVCFFAQSKAQVDALYLDLTAQPEVLMAL